MEEEGEDGTSRPMIRGITKKNRTEDYTIRIIETGGIQVTEEGKGKRGYKKHSVMNREMYLKSEKDGK